VQQIIRAYEEFDATHPQQRGSQKVSAAQRESVRVEQQSAAPALTEAPSPQAPVVKVSALNAPLLEE